MKRCHPDPLDLRSAFTTALRRNAFAPADDDATGPSSAADAGATEPDDAADEGDNGAPDADEVKHPRLKELSAEAAKWRKQFREAQERIRSLEEGAASEALQAENRSLRLRLAWERATTHARLRDVDAAWKLAEDDLKTVEINAGEVDTTRIGEIVGHVVQRYPYLVEPDESSSEPKRDAFPDGTSGRMMNGRRKTSDAVSNRAVLERKFPALRGR